MKIRQLDHVNVRTTQLDVLIDWYTQVLGMSSGRRPDFPFPGAWMYVGDSAVVHLVGKEKTEVLVGSEEALKLEHFSFAATGLAEFEARLQAMDVKYNRVDNEIVGVIQVNLWDPDGNHIHVDFPPAEVE